tara:strand:- start:316 stop:645 length:330 start_codon:yes stop_codon:yes gene_type:complete
MKTKELILNGTDIQALFMSDNVDEILVTEDIEALNLTEATDKDEIDDLEWQEIFDFGLKNIITADFGYYAHKVAYDKVTAVIIRYYDYADGADAETFINNKCERIDLID